MLMWAAKTTQFYAKLRYSIMPNTTVVARGDVREEAAFLGEPY